MEPPRWTFGDDEHTRSRVDVPASPGIPHGLESVLAMLESPDPPGWILGYYLRDATVGELHRRRGDRDRAIGHLTRALDSAPTLAEQTLLRRRLLACAAP